MGASEDLSSLDWFVPRGQATNMLLRIGIPSIGVDESNDVNIKYIRHVLKGLSSYTSVALPRALTNGSTRSSF